MRQIIHKFIAFLTDIYDLFRALSFQFQNQFFKNEIKREDTDKRLFILGNGASLKAGSSDSGRKIGRLCQMPRGKNGEKNYAGRHSQGSGDTVR